MLIQRNLRKVPLFLTYLYPRNFNSENLDLKYSSKKWIITFSKIKTFYPKKRNIICQGKFSSGFPKISFEQNFCPKCDDVNAVCELFESYEHYPRLKRFWVEYHDSTTNDVHRWPLWLGIFFNSNVETNKRNVAIGPMCYTRFIPRGPILKFRFLIGEKTFTQNSLRFDFLFGPFSIT